MKTVKEVSKITGISVRTLHYYDSIGLLKPTELTDAGYRMYDDTALARLQSILLFRELKFTLKEIKEILDSENFNIEEAISQQIELLEMQYKHIGNLISFAREIQTKGVGVMKFEVFNNHEIEKYKEEVKERWGNSKEYKEYEERGVSPDKNYAEDMMSIFAEFGKLINKDPEDKDVQQIVCNLQKYITDNFYNCDKDMLINLGNMYVRDERFKKNIDCAGGEGTAEFVKKAIEIYCSR